MRASLPLPSAGREMLRRLLYLKVSTQASLAVHTAKKEVRHARKHHVAQGICPGARDDGTADCAGTGSDGPAQCVAAGGRCVIGPPTNCVGMIGVRRLQPGPEPGWRHRPCSRLDTTEQRDDEQPRIVVVLGLLDGLHEGQRNAAFLARADCPIRSDWE